MTQEKYAELLENYRKEKRKFAKEVAKYIVDKVLCSASMSSLKVPDVSRVAINVYQDIINELHECIAYHQVLLRTQELANMTMAEQKARREGTFLPIHLLPPGELFIHDDRFWYKLPFGAEINDVNHPFPYLLLGASTYAPFEYLTTKTAGLDTHVIAVRSQQKP
jgi:hypothetical protein